MKPTFLIIMVAVFISGCNTDSRTLRPNAAVDKFAAPSGALLNRFGSLESPDGTLTVDAHRKSVSVVDYFVLDAMSGVTLATGGGFSNAQRWFLFFDSTNRLWVYNSDIGGFGYWQRLDETTMEFVDVGNDTAKSDVPIPVVKNLPSSIKRHFGWD